MATLEERLERALKSDSKKKSKSSVRQRLEELLPKLNDWWPSQNVALAIKSTVHAVEKAMVDLQKEGLVESKMDIVVTRVVPATVFYGKWYKRKRK